MKEYTDLSNILSSFNEIEIKRAKKYILKNGENDELSKQKVLIDLLIKDKKTSEIETYNLLYDGNGKAAFRKLLRRTYLKLLDFMLSKDEILVNDVYDNRAKDIFQLEKNILVSSILRYRGLFQMSETYLDDVIEKCIFYEHYELLNFALNKKKSNLGYINKPKDINKINKLIEFYNEKEIKYNYAIEGYTKYVIQGSIINRETETRKLKKLVDFLSRSGTVTGLTGYYYNYLRIVYYYNIGKYEKCLNLVNDVIDDINASSSLYSRYRIGHAILNKAMFLRMIGDYTSSISVLEEVKKNSLKAFKEYVYEQLILTYLKMNDLNKAKYYTGVLHNLAISSSNIYDLNKVLFFQSVLYLSDKKYKEANLNLNRIIFAGKDFEIWSVFQRMYLIVCNIHLGNYDLCDKYIDSMRKYIERNDKLLVIPRVKHLKSIFMLLSKNSYLSLNNKSKSVREDFGYKYQYDDTPELINMESILSL